MNGVPSIVVGVFVYSIVVLPFKQFSLRLAAIALGSPVSSAHHAEQQRTTEARTREPA